MVRLTNQLKGRNESIMKFGKAIRINNLEVNNNGEIVIAKETMFDTGGWLVLLNYKGIETRLSVDEDDSTYNETLKCIKMIDNNTAEDMELYFKHKDIIHELNTFYIIVDNEVYKPFYKCIEKKIHTAAIETKTTPFDATTDILNEFSWLRLDSKKAVYDKLSKEVNSHFKQTGEKPIEKYLLKEETEQYQKAIVHIKEVESRVK